MHKWLFSDLCNSNTGFVRIHPSGRKILKDKAERGIMIRGNGWKGMEFGVQAEFMTVCIRNIHCLWFHRDAHCSPCQHNMKYGRNLRSPAFEIQESFLETTLPDDTAEKNIFSSYFFFFFLFSDALNSGEYFWIQSLTILSR